jgi:hypothetical protein
MVQELRMNKRMEACGEDENELRAYKLVPKGTVGEIFHSPSSLERKVRAAPPSILAKNRVCSSFTQPTHY